MTATSSCCSGRPGRPGRPDPTRPVGRVDLQRTGAAYGGHFELLQWDEHTCWMAAGSGHLELLQWALWARPEPAQSIE